MTEEQNGYATIEEAEQITGKSRAEILRLFNQGLFSMMLDKHSNWQIQEVYLERIADDRTV